MYVSSWSLFFQGCKAKAGLVKVKEQEEGSFFKIFLSGEGSEGCKKSEWQVMT